MQAAGREGSKEMAEPLARVVIGFERESCALTQFRIESWLGLLFVNLDANAPSLAEVVGELFDERNARDAGAFRFVAAWSLAEAFLC